MGDFAKDKDVPDTNVGDTISRQAAIDLLCRALHYAYSEDYAVTLALELPSAEPEPHWISVTERLPEKSGRYYVTRGLNAAGALWNRVYILNYSDLMGICNHRIWWTGNVGKSDFERIDDVLAWMPLPEPWKGEV